MTAWNPKYRTFSDALRGMTQIFIASQSAVTDLNVGGALRNLLASVAQEVEEATAYLRDVANFHRLSSPSCKGSRLDEVAARYGLTRFPASYSVVELRFTGAESSSVATNATYQTAAGVKFKVVEGGTIAIGETEMTLPAVSLSLGLSTLVPSNTIRYPVTSFPVGISSVTNPAPSNGGQDEEDDDSLKSRCWNRYWALSRGPGEAYLGYCYDATKTLCANYDGSVPDCLVSNANWGVACTVGRYTECNQWRKRAWIIRAKLKPRTNGPASGTIYVIPGGALSVPAWLQEVLTDYISPRVGLTTMVDIALVDFVDVDVRLNITVEPGYALSTAAENARLAVLEYLDYTRWPFGADVSREAVIAQIMGAEGVQDITMYEPAIDIVVGEYELPQLNTFVVNQAIGAT